MSILEEMAHFKENVLITRSEHIKVAAAILDQIGKLIDPFKPTITYQLFDSDDFTKSQYSKRGYKCINEMNIYHNNKNIGGMFVNWYEAYPNYLNVFFWDHVNQAFGWNGLSYNIRRNGNIDDKIPHIEKCFGALFGALL